jgi:hypothetical protein
MRQSHCGHGHGDQNEVALDKKGYGVDFHARGVAQIRVLVNAEAKKQGPETYFS